MQMLLATVVVDAAHAALENAEKAFQRVRMRLATRPFVGAVVHGFVAGEPRSDCRIVRGLIGRQTAFAGDVLHQGRFDGRARDEFDLMERTLPPRSTRLRTFILCPGPRVLRMPRMRPM